MYKKLILGSPGTGKTTRLLGIAEDKLSLYAPEKIAFYSFTKKAISEAVTRAASRFKLDAKRFKNFKTIHALSYHELGINSRQVLSYQHKKQLQAITGYRLTGQNLLEDETLEKGDNFLFLESYARSTKRTLREVWEDGLIDVNWYELKLFVDTYNAFKKEYGLIDFTDMLEKYVAQGSPLDIDIAIIDEAQDLNALQWDVVNKATQNAKEVYIAGDDDQAIYKWSGADVEQFLGLTVTETETLPLSYRLPKEVYTFANTLVTKIKHRYEKHWKPQEKEGSVLYHANLNHIEFSGQWLILTRTNRQLKKIESFLRETGFLYQTKKGHCVVDEHLELIKYYIAAQRTEIIHPTIKKYFEKERQWYESLDIISFSDREYYRTLLRQGFKLTDKPEITLSTIHGAKGGEADNVLLLCDLPKQTYELYTRSPDDEHRVFYVGATRAKKALHILTPQTDLFYDI